ncbi:MAG: YihY family inner membrane protein [Acidiferrobacteraceae bacterium]
MTDSGAGEATGGVSSGERHARLKRFVRRTAGFSLLVLRRFVDDRCSVVAQALSYTTLLAIVPLTTIVITAFSAFPVFKHWTDVLQGFVYGHFLPATGAEVEKYVRQFSNKSIQLTAAGVIVLMITSLMLMAMIEDSFNAIWRSAKRRDPIYRFLVYWAILTLGPLLTGVSLSVTYYVMALPLFSLAPLAWLRIILADVLPFLLATLAFLLLYITVPNARVGKVHALIGATFASVLFQLAKHAFALFILRFSSYRYIYGAVAVLPVFLMWVYLSWVIILMGALVTALLPSWDKLYDSTPAHDPGVPPPGRSV